MIIIINLEGRRFQNTKETVISAPVTIGDTVYITLHDKAPFVANTIHAYSITKTNVTDVSATHGFTVTCDINRTKGLIGEDYDWDNFREWDQIGECVFLSRQDAEDSIKDNNDYAGYNYYEE